MSDISTGGESMMAIARALNEAFAQGGAFSAVTLAEMMNRHGNVRLAPGELTAVLERQEQAGTIIRVLRQPGYEADPESAWPKWRKVTPGDLDKRRVLAWERPPQAEPHEKWGQNQPDSGPPGGWVPNMDDEWRQKWKAVMLGKRAEGPDGLRVEIRKTAVGARTYAQVLIVAWCTGEVVVSMSGKATFTERDWQHMHMAVAEAREQMAAWRLQEARERELAAERARNK